MYFPGAVKTVEASLVGVPSPAFFETRSKAQFVADALPSALGAECGPALLSLLRGLLRLNPACRCTAKDALAHAFCRPTDPAAARAVGDDDVAHISHESAVT